MELGKLGLHLGASTRWPTSEVLEHLLDRGTEWLAKNRQGSSHPAWPGILARLIELRPHNIELREKGWDWQRYADFNDTTWTFVWEALERTTEQGWEYRSALIEMGVRWLDENPLGGAHPAWPGILAHLISNSKDNRDLRSKGWDWLRSDGGTHSWWSDVWIALCNTTDDSWQHRNALLALGQHWFGTHRTDYEGSKWPNMVSRLVRLFPTDAELREAAWTWLEGAGLDHGVGPPVWGVLTETTDEKWQHREALLALGRQWFDAHRTDFDPASWPAIVSRLVRLFPTDAELREAAWTWLEDPALDHGVGPPVLWSALNDTMELNSDDRHRLRRLGLKWIMMFSLNDPSFGRNWEAIFELGERSETFLDLGFKWATNRIGESLPSFIVPKLLSIDNRYDAFLNELIGWLKTEDAASPLWVDKLMVVLKALERRGESIDDDLSLHASNGLAAQDGAHPLWGAVWVSLYEHRPSAAELIVIGLKWVKANQAADAWASVWLRLTSQAGLSTNLIEPAIAWLNLVRLTHNKWSEVWKRIWERTGKDCPRLGPLAIKWLRANQLRPKQRAAWQEISSELWSSGCYLNELQKMEHVSDSSSRRTQR